MLIVNNIENKTMNSVQELHLCLFSFLDKVISTNFVSSIFSVHSLAALCSTNLFTNLFLHLQFL